MKKFYAILMVALMCTTASFAQKALPKAKSLKTPKGTPELTTGMKFSDLKFKTAGEKEGNATVTTKNNGPKKIVYDPTTMITETPPGIEVNYAKYGPYYYVYWFWVVQGENDGTAAQMVWGNDGCLYYKNPLSGFANGTYIKFEKESDDTFVAHLPQAIYYQEGDDESDELVTYAAVMVDTTYVDAEGDTVSTYTPAADQDFRIKIDGDSLRFADPEAQLGMTDNEGGWYGYQDWNQRFGEFTDEVEAIPDGIEDSAIDMLVTYADWYITDEDGNPTSRSGNKVKCALDAATGKAYAKGLFTEMPEAWVVGTYDGSKAVFPSKQYVGIYSDSYYAYFIAASTYKVTGDDGSVTEYYQLEDDITFDVDLSTMVMTTDRHAILNAKKDEIYYIQARYNPELRLFTESTAAPMDPTFTSFMDYNDSYGYGYFGTYMPILDVEGNMMETDDVYYNVYSDDELVTIYQEDYSYMTDEEMTDIPYDYNDSWDIYATGVSHTFYYYFTGFDKIGVQLVHKVGDELKGSALVYYIPATSEFEIDPDGGVNGIEGVVDSTSDVKSVSYTDLSGRMVNNPSKGIFVKSVTLKDGSVKNTKVIK